MAEQQRQTLGQRLAAITGEAHIKATGKTEHGQRAISIGDVDEVLGELMAKHGVASDYQFNGAPVVLWEEETRNGATMRIWQADITAYVWAADDRSDREERRLFDIGSNPSAAVSFALKRWLRALFKLAEDDDQADNQARGESTGQARPAGGGQPRLDWKTLKCPHCAKTGAVAQRRDKTGWFCSAQQDRGGCGKSITNEQIDEQLKAGSAPVVAMLTAEQRAELAALNDRLPTELRLTDEEKRALAGDGFEAMKETLLAREQEALNRAGGRA